MSGSWQHLHFVFVLDKASVSIDIHMKTEISSLGNIISEQIYFLIALPTKHYHMDCKVKLGKDEVTFQKLD